MSSESHSLGGVLSRCYSKDSPTWSLGNPKLFWLSLYFFQRLMRPSNGSSRLVSVGPIDVRLTFPSQVTSPIDPPGQELPGTSVCPGWVYTSPVTSDVTHRPFYSGVRVNSTQFVPPTIIDLHRFLFFIFFFCLRRRPKTTLSGPYTFCLRMENPTI